MEEELMNNLKNDNELSKEELETKFGSIPDDVEIFEGHSIENAKNDSINEDSDVIL